MTFLSGVIILEQEAYNKKNVSRSVIMKNQVLDTQLNLAFDATPEELEKSLELDVGFDDQTRLWEVIVRYAGTVGQNRSTEEFQPGQNHRSTVLLQKEMNGFKQASVTWLSGGYGVVRGTKEAIDALSQNPFIEYIEKPKRLYFATEQGKLTSCMEPLQTGIGFSLFGRGILIAVLDSGIDYTHPEFRNPDGSTRILAIWDQTGNGNPPEGLDLGTEYSREEINEALMGSEKSDPEGADSNVSNRRLIPIRDLSGHGTAVAAIAAGNNGVAPQAQLLIVKLGNPAPDSFPKTTELMMAVEYAYRKALEVQMPLVINLSFGTVYGPHNGTGLLEMYLDEMMGRWKSVIVAGTGNEGNAAGHTTVTLQEGVQTEIQFGVAAGEAGLNVQLWKNYTDQFDIYLRAPDGTQIGPLYENLGPQRYRIGQTNLLIYYGKPSPFMISQEIFFDLIPMNEYVTPGIWQIILEPQRLTDGNVDLWLPSAGTLNPATRFYRPTADNTLTVPSSAGKIIAVGAYDSRSRIYAPFSGRGNPPGRPPLPALSQIRPDLVAPGVDIQTAAVGGGYTSVTGTSFATPFVSGAAAMLMQWGIIDGNDPYLYGEKVRAYLQRGAQRLPGYRQWPNNMVGYGRLCLESSLPD